MNEVSKFRVFEELSLSKEAIGFLSETAKWWSITMVYFFPLYYLFNFSSKMKKTIKNNNQEDLIAYFSNLV